MVADRTRFDFPLNDLWSSIANRQRSDGVDQSAAAAISGKKCHFPLTGVPFLKCPVAARGVKLGGSGSSKVLSVIPAGCRTSLWIKAGKVSGGHSNKDCWE